MKKHITIAKYPELKFIITNTWDNLVCSYAVPRNKSEYTYDSTSVIESVSEVLFGETFPVDWKVADTLLQQGSALQNVSIVSQLQNKLTDLEIQLTKLHDEFVARDKFIMDLPDTI